MDGLTETNCNEFAIDRLNLEGKILVIFCIFHDLFENFEHSISFLRNALIVSLQKCQTNAKEIF